MAIASTWRGVFSDAELNSLHAEAFGVDNVTQSAWGWRAQLERHSLGWITARDHDSLVGFVNVAWDGGVHAWLQDVVVAVASRHQGIGARLVALAREEALKAGCEWLHVDFDAELSEFYFEACGFASTTAGLMHLK